MAAHSDLRHRSLEIERRLGIEPRRLRKPAAPRLAALKRRPSDLRDRFEPPDRVDERAAVTVPRRVVPLQDLSDGFKGAGGVRFGAREPHFKATDHGIRVVSQPRGGRDRPSFVSSSEPFQAFGGGIKPVILRFVVETALLGQTDVVGDCFVKPIIEPHARAPGSLCGGVARPPAHARDIPRHRSIHVLDRRSEARELPVERRRRPAAILSGVMVKKRLSAA